MLPRPFFGFLRPGEPWRWLLPPAVLLALGAFAAAQGDPAARAEVEFLALSIAAVVAAIAALRTVTPQVGSTAAWTAFLGSAACWIAYVGPPRGAAVSAVLAAGLGWALVRDGRTNRTLEPRIAIPAAFGLQALMRPELLLPPLLEMRSLAELLLLPVLVGGAVSVLAERFGGRRAAVAAGAVAILAPGWSLATSLAFGALAAGVVASARERSLGLRLAAVAGLIVLPLWDLPLGVLYALAGACLASAGWTAAVAAAALAVVAVLGPEARGWGEALGFSSGALLALPAFGLVPASGRWRAVHGVFALLAAARIAPEPGGLAVGLALVASSLPLAGAAARLGRWWCGALVAGTTVLAAYPWVRTTPRADFLELLGLERPLPALAWLVLAVAALGWLLDRPRPSAAAGLRPGIVVAAVVALALGSWAGPAEVLVFTYQGVALGQERPHWYRKLEPGPLAAVVIDTNLVGGVDLEAGRTLATLRLHGAERELLERWELRAGTDTAEWASARADVAARPGFEAPPPWLSQVAPGGGFFARRFRTRFERDSAEEVSALAIGVAPDLPAGTRILIYHLEIRR